jgi:hypothetical protein
MSIHPDRKILESVVTPEEKMALAEAKRELVEAIRNPGEARPRKVWGTHDQDELPHKPEKRIPKRLQKKLESAARRNMILAAQKRHYLWEEAKKRGRHLYAIDGGKS